MIEHNWIRGYNFPSNTDVNVSIQGSSTLNFTITTDSSGSFNTGGTTLLQTYSLQRGDSILAVYGANQASMVIQNFYGYVDVNNNLITGGAFTPGSMKPLSGSSVHVVIFLQWGDSSNIFQGDTTVGTDGLFSLNTGSFDLIAGQKVFMTLNDSTNGTQGNLTDTAPYNAIPYLSADIAYNWIGGNQFPSNSQVDVTIKASGASTPKASVTIQSDGNGSFWTNGNESWKGVSLAVGDVIQATCNSQQTSMVIQNLQGVVSSDFKSITGTAKSPTGTFMTGSRVDLYVNAANGGGQLYSANTTVGSNGTFSFDLTGKYTLVKGQQIMLNLWDDSSGNQSGNQNIYHPYNAIPLFAVSLSDNSISGQDFPANSSISISINSNPALTNAYTTNSDGSFKQNINNLKYTMKAGDIVTISYGAAIYGTAKVLSYTIPNLTATANAASNTISGVAPDYKNQSILITIFSSSNQILYQTTVQVDANGNFSSNLPSGTGNFDLVSGQNIVISTPGASAGITVYNGTISIQGNVALIHQEDGRIQTVYEIYIWPDANAVIDGIKITGPNGDLPYSKTDFIQDINDYRDYTVYEDGAPAPGTYTFTVTSGSNTVTAQDTQYINRTISNPLIVSPAANSTVTSKTPAFEWQPVSYPATNIAYRLYIYDAVTGYQIVSTPRTWGMLSYTVPANTLKQGQTYKFQIRTYDSDNWSNIQNSSRSEWRTFTMGTTLQHASVPALGLDGGFGAYTMTQTDGVGLALDVNVVDLDGVAADGSSHRVTVSTPYGVINVPFSSTLSAYSAEYWTYIDVPGKGFSPVDSRDYVFTVTDPDGNTGTLTDSLVVNPLPIINSNSIVPASGTTLTDTEPVFTWDSVFGANWYRVKVVSDDYSKTIWSGQSGKNSYSTPPGVLQPNTSYRYRVDARDGHLNLNLNNFSTTPDMMGQYIQFTTGAQVQKPFLKSEFFGAHTVTTDQDANLRFLVSVYDAQGVPDNIQSVTVTLPDSSVKTLSYVSGDSRNSAFCGIYQSTGTIQVPASGSNTYIFNVTDINNNSSSLSEKMTVDPIGYPARSSLIPLQGALLPDTAADFNWAAVSGAAFYQILIYDASNTLVYTLSTAENSYHLPPGFLKKGAVYHYQIATYREFKEQNVDNESLIPADSSTKMWFSTAGGTVMKGDVNGDGIISLEDIILSLQILSGKSVTTLSAADVDGDDKIGIPEALYDMQKVAGLR